MAPSKHFHQGFKSHPNRSTNDSLRLSTLTKRAYQAPFPFFDLPREVREQVYSLVSPTQTPSKSRRPQYRYDDVRRYTYYLPDFMLGAYQWEDNVDKTSAHLVQVQFPEWIPANQQFLAEAIQAFVRGKVFDIQSYGPGERKPKHRNCWLRSSSASDKSVDVYRDLLLVRAIRSIKVPRVENLNIYYSNWDSTISRFAKCDEEAMLAFSKLRGADVLPPTLELEWYYHLAHWNMYNKTPTFDSPTLRAWRNMFAKVTITVTIQDSFLITTIINGTLGESSREDKRFIYDKLYQHAAAWAHWLVRDSNEEEQYFGVSKQAVKSHWTTLRTYSHTMEAVDRNTRRTTPLKPLHYS
jgi:hypothetical protein